MIRIGARPRNAARTRVVARPAAPVRIRSTALATRLPVGSAALLDDYPAVLRVREKT